MERWLFVVMIMKSVVKVYIRCIVVSESCACMLTCEFLSERTLQKHFVHEVILGGNCHVEGKMTEVLLFICLYDFTEQFCRHQK